jgi:hypothetical protein
MTDIDSSLIDIGWSCERLAAHLADGAPELGPADSAMLSMHLETCDGCRSRIAEYLKGALSARPLSFQNVVAELEAGQVGLSLDGKIYPIAALSNARGAFAVSGLSITTLIHHRFAVLKAHKEVKCHLVGHLWSWPIELHGLEDLRPNTPGVLRLAAGQKPRLADSSPVQDPMPVFRYSTSAVTITVLSTADDRIVFTLARRVS